MTLFVFHIFFLESPTRPSHTPNNSGESQKSESCEKLSPQPPPRGRHNPFNKPTTSHHRSPQRKDAMLFRKTFKELHNQLGRPILRDRNEWRFGLIKKESNFQEPLITL